MERKKWKKKIDLTGEKFGRLIAIERDEERSKNKKWKTYWKCTCDCGKEKSVFIGHLRSGHTKSCGCRKSEVARENAKKTFSLPFGEAPKRALYCQYRHSAKKSNRDFDLSLEDFFIITQKPCYYCGTLPSNIIKYSRDKNNYLLYSGIDRINNNIGYIGKNVVPCCEFCNKTKRDLSLTDFYSYIKILYQNLVETKQI